MTTTARHVLVVNYDFPPNAGIGGRRWGCLARGMADRGWQVHAVKADPLPGRNNSVWRKVIEHPNIEVHSLPRRYPQVLTHQPGRACVPSLVHRIHHRAALAWTSLAYRGTPYDISLGWEKVLLPCLQKIITACPVKWIFATGAPWDMLRVIAHHKTLHQEQDLRLWFDFRDPWLLDQPDYGMRTLGARKSIEEKAKARMIMEQADVISAPDGAILRGFTQAGAPPRETTQLVVLPHFYVPQESTPLFNPSSDGTIRIVYGGTVYAGTRAYLEAMASDLDKLRVQQPDIYARLRIDFYTDNGSVIEQIFSRHATVRALAGVGTGIYDQIAVARWCMILGAGHNKDYFTTKYYEFQPIGTPYLHVGEHGAVARRIVDQGRGLDWQSFLTRCLAGTPPDPMLFRQQASVADSLDHRISEIEACMKKGS